MGSWVPTDRNPDNDWTINGTDMYSAVSGKVGIGTSTPVKLFHVDGGSLNSDVALFESSDDYTVVSVNSNTSSNNGGGFYFSQYNDEDVAYFGGQRLSSGDTTALMGVGAPTGGIISNPELNLQKSNTYQRLNLQVFGSASNPKEFSMKYTNSSNSSESFLISDTIYFRGGPNFSDPTEFFVSGKTTSDNIIAYNGFRYENAPNSGYILQSDNVGNATWVDPTTISAADDGDWNTSGVGVIYNVNDNVGIGTNLPNYPLEINTSSNDRALYIINSTNSNSGFGKFGIYSNTSGGGSGDNIGGWFDASGSGTGINYGVSGQALGTAGENRAIYGNAASGTTNWAGYFDFGNVHIKNNIGVGTTTLNLSGNTRSLTISASDTYQSGKIASLELKGSDGTSNGTTNTINFYHQFTTGVAYEVAKIETKRSGALYEGQLLFYTADSINSLIENMRIDENGNVGIGTSSPSEKLDVVGNVEGYYFKGDVLNDKGTAQPLRLYGNGTVLFGSDNNNDGTGGFTWYNNGEAGANIVMTLSEVGNLGIGNSNPGSRLDIASSGSTSASSSLNITNTAGNNIFHVRDDGFVGINQTTPIGAANFVVNDYDNSSWGGMYTNVNNASGKPFYGYAINGTNVTYSYIDGTDGNKLKWYYGGDRITLTSAGDLGIGNTSPTYRLHVSEATNGYVANIENTLGDDGLRIEIPTVTPPTSAFWIGCYANGSLDGGIRGNGSGGASLYSASDRRLKQNIIDFPNPLDLLSKIKARQYEMIQSPGIKTYGFIAQELFEVFPLAVAVPENEDDIFMVDYSALTPLLVGATNELHEKMNSQKLELEKLKAENQELKDELQLIKNKLGIK